MGAPAVATPKRSRPTPKRAPTAPKRARPRGNAGRAATARTERAPARRTTPTRRANNNVIRFPVTAVGRTAGAVGDLADSGVVVGMTRGRTWIVVLSILLGGIVAVNVLGLTLSADGSATAVKIDDLERQNSVLRGRVASRLSNDKVSAAAARLGLSTPAPGEVGYLTAERRDVEEAVRRLTAGEITLAAPVVDPVESTATVPVVPETPATPSVPATPAEAPAGTPTEAPAKTVPVAPPTAEAPTVDPGGAAGGLTPGAAIP